MPGRRWCCHIVTAVGPWWSAWWSGPADDLPRTRGARTTGWVPLYDGADDDGRRHRWSGPAGAGGAGPVPNGHHRTDAPDHLAGRADRTDEAPAGQTARRRAHRPHITLPQAGRTRVWHPTPYGAQVAGEWPELRGRRPSRGAVDRTAVRLKVGHGLTVTETALAFLQDARHRSDLCRPLDWIPEVHHPLGGGEAVIPDALLYYQRRPTDRADDANRTTQVERCVAAADALPTGTIFLDGERPCQELADEVLTRIGVSVSS
ncbi:replication-relaxation family protein [Streptomyces fungicidicus]|uniref:replication-relaxation family protein n=1 Tax=Streptomyces fungicidicus TaxID=68203 RepID=UPI00369CDA4F